MKFFLSELWFSFASTFPLAKARISGQKRSGYYAHLIKAIENPGLSDRFVHNVFARHISEVHENRRSAILDAIGTSRPNLLLKLAKSFEFRN